MEEKKEQLALRFKTLEKALSSLEEALNQPYSIFIRDATIQRFEYTFELTWKLLRSAAKIEGREANSPRQAIRVAYETGMIKDIDLWFEMLEDRNKTSHTYSEQIAVLVYNSAQRFPDLLRAALQEMREIYLK